MKRKIDKFSPTLALAMGAAAMIVAAQPATAQGPGSARGAAMFERMDTDGSGTISLDEFTARAMARFETLDTDGDGAISVEEAQKMGPPEGARGMGMGRHGGRGGDGYGMRGQPGMGPGYGMGQGMGPGYGMGPGGGMGQGMGPGGGMGPGFGRGAPGGGFGPFGGLTGDGPMGYGGFGDPTLTPEERADRARSLVEMLDADGDGKLSAQEMAQRPGPQMIFNRLDSDGDGNISQQEFDAAAQRFGAMRGRW